MKTLISIFIALCMLFGFMPPAQAAPVTHKVMTLNIHGAKDKHGNGNAGSSTKLLADIIPIVKSNVPEAIGFQEMCRKQFKSFETQLKKLGYYGTMTYVRSDPGCNDKANGNKFGNAVFMKGKITWRASYGLPWGKNKVGTTGRQPRRMLCATNAANWRFCTVHLTPSDPDRANQAKLVNSKMLSWGSKRVLAGDLNMGVSDVTKFFPSFDHQGARIDHVVTNGDASVVKTVVVPSSDHPAVFSDIHWE